MDTQAAARIPQPFCDMPDPRRNNHRHSLNSIVTIALFAIICGAEDWAAVALYGRSKHDWLNTFLDLPHGIPSHDTFNDLFNRLHPDAFEACFQAWMASMVQLTGGKLVAIDGKSLRRSFKLGADKSGMSHMVSAFVQANSMVFAQVKAEGPGQELSAIERLIAMLDLKGAVVTIDAIATNVEIAGQIVAAGADFVLPVKGNQPILQGKLSRAMDDAILDGFPELKHDCFVETDGDHGRIETRKLWVCWNVELLLGKELMAEWPSIGALIAIERTRELNGKTTVARHYYISSLDGRTKAKTLAGFIRGHWSIENNLHWQLDVSFNEDQRRLRTGNGAENSSRLSRIALNLLKRENTATCGILNKRKLCGWDNDYILKVLLA